MPGRLVAGGLSALLLAATVARLPSAIRAGLHQGTRGFWVATTRKCVRSACTWNGKFVSDGHVLLSSAQYYGRLPAGIRAGTPVAGLFTGGSGIVFPATGSDLWMSLLASASSGCARAVLVEPPAREELHPAAPVRQMAPGLGRERSASAALQQCLACPGLN